jgi:GTP-binding protein HflX
MTRLHEVNSDKKPKVLLVGVGLPGVSDLENQASLDELSRLVVTLGFEVIGRTTQKRSSHNSALVLGEGKLASLARTTGGPGALAARPVPNARNPKLKKAFLKKAQAESEDDDADDSDVNDDEELGEWELHDGEPDGGSPIENENLSAKPEVVIFDMELTPSQTRNLERALAVDIMDRTAVIIEIFSRHARTRAARLQVEIAKLTYMAPRIRETGGGEDRGGGGVGAKGSGESSVELDRRKIRDRIKELKGEFASIDKEHDTRRARRSEVRSVALVGYTNAGKSSLMRAMTGSEVYVADKLFATLDTTVRPLYPPSRPAILISDTVGFIKKLPHDLVASFKSTLDEALGASLLLYVVDSSDPSFRSQLEVTRSVLAEVGASEVPGKLILNKSDRLSEEMKATLMQEFPEARLLSTRNKDDVGALREEVLLHFEGGMVDEDVFIPYNVEGAIGEIRSQMRVLEESYEAGGVRLKLRARSADIARIRARHGL